MTKDADTLIGENRRDILNNFGRFERIDVNRRRSFAFGLNPISVDVDATVERRDRGQQVIFGHPDGERHGFDRGTFGDDKGAWETVGGTVDGTLDTSWVVDLLLSGATSDGLQTLRQYNRGNGFNVSKENAPNELTLRATIPTVDYASGSGASTTVTAYDGAGGKVVDVELNNTANADIDASDDLRVSLDLTVSGNATGNSVITQNAEGGIVELFDFLQPTSFEFDRFVFGDTNGTLDKSSDGLTNEVFDAELSRAKKGGDIKLTSQVTPSDIIDVSPTTIKQVGVTNADGALLFGTPTANTTVTDDATFLATLVLRITQG